MPTYCAAYGCSNRQSSQLTKKALKAKLAIPQLSYHAFPLRDPPRLRQWVTALKRENFKPTKFTRLCSAHFVADDFGRDLVAELMPDAGTRRIKNLKPEAVPSIFHYKKQPATRQASKRQVSKRQVSKRQAQLKERQQMDQPEHVCIVGGCPSTTFHGVTFHSFPFKNPCLSQKWTDFVSSTRLSWKGPNKKSFICSNHFTADSYICDPTLMEKHGFRADSKLRIFLVAEAVPSLIALPEETPAESSSIPPKILTVKDESQSDALHQPNKSGVQEAVFSFTLSENDLVGEWNVVQAMFPDARNQMSLAMRHLLQVHANNCTDCHCPNQTPSDQLENDSQAVVIKTEPVEDQVDESLEEIIPAQLVWETGIDWEMNESQEVEENQTDKTPAAEAEINERLENCIESDKENEEDVLIGEPDDPEYVPKADSGDEKTNKTSHIVRRSFRSRRLPRQMEEGEYSSVESLYKHACKICHVRKASMVAVWNHLLHDHTERLALVPIQPSLSSIKTKKKKSVNQTKDEFKRDSLKQCKLCGKHFVFWKSYMKHECSGRRLQLPKGSNRWSCTSCSRRFATKSQLRVHGITTHKQPRDSLRQTLIKKRKTQLEEYKRWRRVLETNYRQFLPWIIKVKSSVPDRSENPARLKQFHKKKFRMTCHVCRIEYRQFDRKVDHLMNVHGIRTRGIHYVCDICKRGFAHKHRYENHLADRHEEKRFSCSYCGKGLNTQFKLKHHIEYYHENAEYNCDLCDKVLKSEFLLARHKARHAKPVVAKCPFEGCGKKFAKNYNLKVHMRSHTGEKPYVCDQCAFSCANRNSLNYHMLQSHQINIRKSRNALEYF